MIGFWRLLFRYRRALILATALILAFLLMTLQVRHDRAAVSFTRQAVLFVLSPVLKVASVTVGSGVQVWRDYVDLRTLRKENQHLTREAAALKRRISQLEEQALETQRLQRMLALRENQPAGFVAARVVGKDASSWFKSLLVDQGSLAGVRRNLPVIRRGFSGSHKHVLA